MEEYNKEKLHELAKELFALCLDKGINFMSISNEEVNITANKHYVSYLTKELFNFNYYKNIEEEFIPIWELIEKVKQL